MYSIGQVAEMFGLPISTLRYYDKQGLFPNMERKHSIMLTVSPYWKDWRQSANVPECTSEALELRA